MLQTKKIVCDLHPSYPAYAQTVAHVLQTKKIVCDLHAPRLLARTCGKAGPCYKRRRSFVICTLWNLTTDVLQTKKIVCDLHMASPFKMCYKRRRSFVICTPLAGAFSWPDLCYKRRRSFVICTCRCRLACSKSLWCYKRRRSFVICTSRSKKGCCATNEEDRL